MVAANPAARLAGTSEPLTGRTRHTVERRTLPANGRTVARRERSPLNWERLPLNWKRLRGVPAAFDGGGRLAAFDLKPDGLPMVATGGRLPESLPDRLTGGAANFRPTVERLPASGVR